MPPLPCSSGLLQALRAATWDSPSLRRTSSIGQAYCPAKSARPLRTAAPPRCYSSASCTLTTHTNQCSVSQLRGFSSSSRRCYRTVQEAKARHHSGPFSWKAAAALVVAGVGLTIYFREEKARLERKRIAEQTKGIGKPKVGGPFDLIDQDGKRFTSNDMKGKYALIYFGFTHCPDICPEELDKMASMYDAVNEETGHKLLRPIFISCDPARDTPAVVKEYLKEFHKDFIGLTGEYDEVKNTCKLYRVYFSTPPHLKPGQDYLVDHSIYFYLMDPEGDFVEALGRTHTAQDAAKIIADHIKDWKGRLDTGQ